MSSTTWVGAEPSPVLPLQASVPGQSNFRCFPPGQVISHQDLWAAHPNWTPKQLQYGTHSTNNLWAHNYYLVKIFADFKRKIMIHYGHNFAHVTTAQLSWHVQNHDLIGLLRSKLEQNKFTRFQLWAHELFAKWPPGSHLNRKMLSHQYM